MAVHPSMLSPPAPHAGPGEALQALLSEGQTWGDSAEWLPALPSESVDLWFTSPPYADARAYSRIHPDRDVDWFLPYGKPYTDLGADFYASRETPQARQDYLIRQLQKLNPGCVITVTPAEAA